MNQETLDRISKFSEGLDWDLFHSPDDLAKSIVIEAADLLDLVNRYHEELFM